MEDDKITAYQRQVILEMTRLVSNALTKKFKNVSKGVGKIMGGKVIETEASKIRKERDSEHARAMLEDGLNPERVARILRISERELYELTKAKHVQTT